MGVCAAITWCAMRPPQAVDAHTFVKPKPAPSPAGCNTLVLQAFKHANLGAVEIMYWLCALCALTLLPISLGVDGTDWGAQFRHAALLLCCAALASKLGRAAARSADCRLIDKPQPFLG